MMMKASLNLCDTLGADACNLKCGRSTCQVRIALAGRTGFVIAILGVTTGANTAGEISMQYKPPSSCWSQPAAYQVFDVKPTNVFKWAAVSAGRMPDLDCADAKKANLLSLEYIAKPFCQAPEDFPGSGSSGLESCVPTKPLCKEDVINAVESAIGGGIKTAAYEWSSVKTPTMRLVGDGTCSMAGTNTKRVTEGRVMFLTFDGGSDCGESVHEIGTGLETASDKFVSDCDWKAEAGEDSVEATLYEFTCGKTQDDAKFTLADTKETAAYLDGDAKAGKFALRFDREVTFGRVLASHLDNAAHAAGTLSLYVRSVGAIPKDGEVIATFADPGIVEADWKTGAGQASDRLVPPPSYITMGRGLHSSTFQVNLSLFFR
jgi:hypothetical protein